MNNTNDELNEMDAEFCPGDSVKIIEGCEDGGDDWAIGKCGVIESVDEDGYCEVWVEEDVTGTYLFGGCQLCKLDSDVCDSRAEVV
jgi:hypothetical protein